MTDPPADEEVTSSGFPDLFGAIFRSAGMGIAVVDDDGHLVRTNAALQRMWGYSAEELRGMAFDDISHPDDATADREQFREVLDRTRTGYQFEKRFIHSAGHVVWGRVTVSLLRKYERRSVLAVVMVEDVSSRKEAEEALIRERAYLEHLFESIPEGVVLVDTQDRVLRINPEFSRLFGYESDEAVGRHLEDLIIPPGREEEARAITRRISEGERVRLDTFRRSKDGTPIEVGVVGTSVEFDGRGIAVYGIYQDIRERKSLESALRRASTTDELTGVLNRRGFLALARREWKLARRRDHEMMLIYADLDDFKEINDEFGHAEGDQVLRSVGRLMRDSVRATDLIARMGGDEFVALAVEAKTDAAIFSRIEESIRRFNADSGLPYQIAMSMGSVTIPARSVGSLEELLSKADARMYEEKRRRHAAS